jgi:hypothetical protein
VHIRAGFRAVVRRPALVLGEVAWRWASGAAAWTLVIFAIRRILAHVDITQAELLLARRSDVFLIADAGAHIVVQVLPQLARECLVLAPAIAVLWIAAATLGRAITLQSLFSTDVLPSEDAPADPPAPRLSDAGASEARDPHFGPLLALNFIRAVFTLATLIAFLGALFLTGLAMPAQNPAAAALVGILVAALIGFFWSVVNWFLALAPIWIVRNGHSALRSIADSVDFYRRVPGPYLGIASGFGFLRAAAMVAAFVAALLASQATLATSIALCVVIAIIYFAVADFLYIARLAGFVALDERFQPSAISSQPIAPAPEPIMKLPSEADS